MEKKKGRLARRRVRQSGVAELASSASSLCLSIGGGLMTSRASPPPANPQRRRRPPFSNDKFVEVRRRRRWALDISSLDSLPPFLLFSLHPVHLCKIGTAPFKFSPPLRRHWTTPASPITVFLSPCPSIQIGSNSGSSSLNSFA